MPLTLAVALAGILLLALGTWQVRRLAWKETLIAEIEAGLAAEPLLVEPTTDAAALRAWRPVRLRAKMMAGSSRRLGVEGREGRPGSRLLGVFRDEAGRSWLVDRGWIPEEASAATSRRS